MKKVLLYHYTDINALVSILTKDHIVLRATNILYLNDSKEVKEGLERIKNYLGVRQILSNKIAQINSFTDFIAKNIYSFFFPNIYVISFSECIDDLNMWRAYADNGKGCALCFELEKIEKDFEKYKDWGVFNPCIYTKDDIEKELNAQIKPFFPEHLMEGYKLKESELMNLVHNILNLCLLIKNKCYEYEKERRYLFNNNNNITNEEIKFRVRNNYIVPFIEFEISKSALSEVIIGPTSNIDLQAISIESLLRINGYFDENNKNIRVNKSEIPYRG